MTPTEFINAVRTHPIIGRGTCSPIDECYTDAELIDAFGGKADPLAAAVATHEVWADRLEDMLGW